MTTSTDRYDVIIIGSGAGGGTLAHRLAPTGNRILLLERGDFVPHEKDDWVPRSVNLDGRYQAKETWKTGGGEDLHNGTVRFGRDPRSSALDASCKAHELDNLYVVDASFFPSSGAVNPALTVMANALRVGDHLAERLG